MTRAAFLGSIVISLTGCAAHGQPWPMAAPSAAAPAAARGSATRVQVWGRNDGPPGLEKAGVTAFVSAHSPALRDACWSGKADEWESGDVEYGVAIDPSGAVIPVGDGSELTAPAADVEREGTRVSSPELASCVERQVGNWTFPRANVPTWMLLRFSFRD